MTPREIHDHAERYRMFRDKRWRQGYCAGLTTAHGRETMQTIRELGEARDRGQSDMLMTVYRMQDAARSMANAFSRSVRAIFQQG